jgi:uncharacterized membrane protein
MNWAHLHLMLNHFPVIGTVFGLALLAWGMWRRHEPTQRAALATFVIVALIAVPVYLTGDPAADAVERLAGTTENAIDAHEDAALTSLIGLELLGAIALAGIVFKKPDVLRLARRAALLFSFVTAGLMARTANLGGKIRHTEIGAPGSAGSATVHDDEGGEVH